MRRRVGNICIAVGAVLIAAALGLFGYNQYDNARAGNAAEDILAEVEAAISGSTNTPDPYSDEMTEAEIDGVAYVGYVNIPSIGITLPVASGWSYAQLRTSPCRYYGSTKTDDLVIAAHNYARHFGKLKNLSIGDTVTFTDMDGTVTVYEVAELYTLEPTAIEEMTDGGYPLTLFTCTYGGATRVTVRCEYAE